MLVYCGSTSRVVFMAGAKDSIDDCMAPMWPVVSRNKQSKEVHFIIALRLHKQKNAVCTAFN